MTPNRLQSKLVEYVQNMHAMEQNVLLMLDSINCTNQQHPEGSLLCHAG